ncbi:hypothetical protein L1987_82603 [Smallanthus sonchifolius]|uniref:Uncharacterized protein n=1 Tax=Smallanthus sonchifolius TaxID=185202 RepID=A0ACB8YA66_9ASTR|nr:hypothetical protein L1987_82603 [Smallanthus sonchifolius]
MCSYSTLPLYALVTQMGTHFKKSIFDEHIQAKVVGWTLQAKKKMAHNRLESLVPLFIVKLTRTRSRKIAVIHSMI